MEHFEAMAMLKDLAPDFGVPSDRIFSISHNHLTRKEWGEMMGLSFTPFDLIFYDPWVTLATAWATTWYREDKAIAIHFPVSAIKHLNEWELTTTLAHEAAHYVLPYGIEKQDHGPIWRSVADLFYPCPGPAVRMNCKTRNEAYFNEQLKTFPEYGLTDHWDESELPFF